MSVLCFAEDFSKLVMRYMKHMPLNNTHVSKNVIVPLTNDQITYTVHHVLRALGIKDNEDNDSVANFVTSNKEATSIVSKINRTEDTENTSRFEDGSLTTVTDSLSDTSIKVEKGTEDSLNTLQSEKKFISRSNPAICVSINRSDTFVCKEDQDTNSNINEVFEDSCVYNSLSDNLLQSLEEIKQSALKITLKIDDLRKRTSQMSKPEQSLSSNSLLRLNRSSTLIKKGSSNINRATTFSGKSTPSKLYVTEKEDTLASRRKSFGGAAHGIITPKKLRSTKMDHSMSKLNGSTLHMNKSPSVSPNFPKLTKNPKYAHVKSTIPKPVSLNKKKDIATVISPE